ncbi:MAG TPA: NUDIX domain-containing protein [Actinomycetota bacterium]|jgi:8-oxo-dGTP diphosphatase
MEFTPPPASVAVDLVVLTVREGGFRALTIRRAIPPYAGRWALPGGFVLPREGLLAAATRELAEETGLGGMDVHLEQLATYGDPDRDPRGRVVSVAYLALAPDLPSPQAGTDAAAARWSPVEDLLYSPRKLAFDHHRILADGVERARAKLEYTPLAASFCPPEFTVAELRRVYEAVWGASLDPRNFHRKVTGTEGFVTPTGRTTTRDGGRPAQLYRRGPAATLHPPLLRAG